MQDRRNRRWPGRRDWLGLAALLACGLAATATSPFRVVHPRSYPAWSLSGQTTATVQDTHLAAWVSKSGKTGIGITVRAERCGATPPEVTVQGAALTVGEQRFSGKSAREVEPPRPRRKTRGPAEPPPPTVSRRYLYVPIPFDNEALWNAGQNQGRLELRISVGGKPVALDADARQQRKGYHRSVSFGALPPCEALPSRCPDAGPPASQPASAPASAPVLEQVDAGPSQGGGTR